VETSGVAQPAALQGGIRFEHVSHQHNADQAGAANVGVQDIQLDLPPGHMVALVGPSGSGKTTLAMLACGLLRPQQGHITVDGVELQTIEPRAWRRHVGWVPQDALLGDGSVRDNLVFGLGEVDDARIDALLRETGCAEFVARLPEGLDTPLGHHGHRLSGGERQRLALARALLREPRLLVLDEPTSALDGESERMVLTALARTRSERTTLVIAHRLSTVADADCIVVMDAGRIVDQGRHAELLARCALYRRLWQPEGTNT
jgi:ABC-type multidrug transport system fused ATPase/permease subunit